MESIKITIATVIAAANSIALGIPSQLEIGPAIARPIGRSKSDPIASKDEILESVSLGTVLCKAVGQMLAQRSKTIPQIKAQIAINQSD